MSIPKFTRLTTTACPLNIENIDTDQIIPARFLKAVERKGFGDNLFRDWRFDKAGARVDGFPAERFALRGRDFGRREELRLAARRASTRPGPFSTTASAWSCRAFSPTYSRTMR